MMRPTFLVEGVTLHVGPTLIEELFTKIWWFSFNPEFRWVVVCSLVKGTCVPEMVREWSEFGSEFRSELEFE